ncbi:MAG: ABC-2 family transporter protein [Clostridia bacterium]|nr:ABC-2 family transporter protein [Clostridia bacterium]
MSVRPYLSAFRTRFKLETRYIGAALGGLGCQLFFALILIALYRALYAYRPQETPLQAIVAYVWLQQAGFRLLLAQDRDLLDTIRLGGMAYTLVRPVDQYSYWYARTLAQKIMGCLMRGIPMSLIAALLPTGWSLPAPAGLGAFLLFLCSLLLGALCVSALDGISMGVTIRTLDARGILALLNLLMVTMSGNLIPLSFFPDSWQAVLRFSPYTQLLDTPIRLYTGEFGPLQALPALLTQAGWLVLLIVLGRLIWRKNLRRVVVQGG